MTLTPPANFSQDLYLDDQQGSINLVAVTPLNYNSSTHTIAVGTASAGSSGVITTTAQTIAGEKTFTSNIKVPSLPLDGLHATSKAYVDNLCLYSQSYQPSIEKFHNFSAGDPSPIAIGFRYIALTTYGGLTKDYIYVVLTTTPGVTYQELIPVEGWALYDKATDENYIFTDAGIWTKFGMTLDHNDLINKGTLTHSTIDSYLNQSVKTTSSPSFTGVNVNGGALQLYSPDLGSSVGITIADTTGLMTFLPTTAGADYRFKKLTTAGTVTLEGNLSCDDATDVDPLTNVSSRFMGGVKVVKSICLDNSSYGYMYRNYQNADNEHSLVSSNQGPVLNARCASYTPIWNFNNYSTYGTPNRNFTLKLNACDGTTANGYTSIRTEQSGYSIIETSGTGTPTNTINFSSLDQVRVLNTTDSTSDTTGSFAVSGGCAISSKLSVGGGIDVYSPANTSKFSMSCADSTGIATFTHSSVGIAKSFEFAGSATDGVIHSSCSKPATSSTIASVVLDGGMGLAGALYGASSLNAGTSMLNEGFRMASATTNSYLQPSNNARGTGDWNDIIIAPYASTTAKYTFGSDTMTLSSSTDGDGATATGSLKTLGGAYITKKIVTGTNGGLSIYDTSTHQSAIVQTASGLQINNYTGSANPAWTFNNYSTNGTPDKSFTFQLNACNGSTANGSTTILTDQTGVCTISCTGASTAQIKTHADDVVTIQNTTESTSITTGGLVVSGGLGVSKRVTATNMTCATAPSADTDVVRKIDVSLPTTETSSGAYWQGPGCSTEQYQTIYVVKTGILSSVGTKTEISFTADGTGGYLTLYVYGLSAGFRPAVTNNIPVIMEVASVYTTGFLNVSSVGVLTLSCPYGWVNGNAVSILPFCCQYMI
jgi:hypothetical protein